MEGFTIIDGVVAAVVVVSALLAFARGFMRELLSIGGWVAAAALAFVFADSVDPFVKELPMVGDFLRESCQISIIVSFFSVMAVVLVLFSLLSPVFSSLVQQSVLGSLDQGLGFLFGVARGILLVVIAFFVYNTVITSQNLTIVDNSRSAAVFSGLTNKIEQQDPRAALGWITGKYEALVGACEN